MENSEDIQTIKQMKTLNINITSIFDIPNDDNLDIKKTNDFIFKTENLSEFEKNNPEKIKEIWEVWRSFSFDNFRK